MLRSAITSHCWKRKLRRPPKMTMRRSRGDGGLYWSESRQRWIAEVTIGYDGRGKSSPRSTRPTPAGNARTGTCTLPGRLALAGPRPPRRTAMAATAARPPRSPPPRRPSPMGNGSGTPPGASRSRGHRRDPGPARPPARRRPASAPPGAARPARSSPLPVHPPAASSPALGRWIEGAPASDGPPGPPVPRRAPASHASAARPSPSEGITHQQHVAFHRGGTRVPRRSFRAHRRGLASSGVSMPIRGR